MIMMHALVHSFTKTSNQTSLKYIHTSILYHSIPSKQVVTTQFLGQTSTRNIAWSQIPKTKKLKRLES